MKNRIRAVAFALAAVCVQAAHADASPAFKFTGTVIAGSYLAQPGARIEGTFRYAIENMSPKKQIELYGGPVTNAVQYGMGAPAGISAKVGGHTITGEGLSVTVVDNFGGNVEDMIQVTGAYVPGYGGGGIVLDGTTYAQGQFGFGLATGPGHTEVLKDTRLPREFPVDAFDAGREGTLLIDGSPEGMLLLFRVDSIEQAQ